MHFVHLTASTFYGGPERQMLGLADHLPADCRTTVACFREGGRGGEFLRATAERGHDAVGLANDTPRLLAAAGELAGLLRDRGAGVLFCHGYKANLVGRPAARRAGIPAVAVSRGWTGENRKVRVYEWLDRRHLPLMDRVVCVSAGQAARVRRAGVPADQVTVIRNAARPEAFDTPDPAARRELLAQFAPDAGVSRVVVAAGRLSPEKGFDVLVEAAGRFLRADRRCGVVVYGEGSERPRLERRVAELGVGDRFVLPGFTRELDRLLPAADVLALASHTEGLPNVVLEAAAAGVPVVATAVGGTPEAVLDGQTGYLVPAADPATLADRLAALLADGPGRRAMSEAAREFVRDRFSFAAQAEAYLQLAHSLVGVPAAVPA
jgi:glycosyltransferase involved in cell wall biosynthesis